MGLHKIAIINHKTNIARIFCIKTDYSRQYLDYFNGEESEWQ